MCQGWVATGGFGRLHNVNHNLYFLQNNVRMMKSRNVTSGAIINDGRDEKFIQNVGRKN
jgi:hypothetical protein